MRAKGTRLAALAAVAFGAAAAIGWSWVVRDPNAHISGWERLLPVGIAWATFATAACLFLACRNDNDVSLKIREEAAAKRLAEIQQRRERLRRAA